MWEKIISRGKEERGEINVYRPDLIMREKEKEEEEEEDNRRKNRWFE